VSGLSSAEFEKFWDRLDAEALAVKQPQEATVRLVSFYRGLDDEDRAVVERALAARVLAPDDDGGPNDRRRFDALVLTREFKILSALPALQERVENLSGAVDGPPRAEREWIEEIGSELA
jgi:hypothetical protein